MSLSTHRTRGLCHKVNLVLEMLINCIGKAWGGMRPGTWNCPACPANGKTTGSRPCYAGFFLRTCLSPMAVRKRGLSAKHPFCTSYVLTVLGRFQACTCTALLPSPCGAFQRRPTSYTHLISTRTSEACFQACLSGQQESQGKQPSSLSPSPLHGHAMCRATEAWRVRLGRGGDAPSLR